MYLKFLLFISIKIELIDPRPKLNNTQYIDFILLRNECYKLQDFKSEINTFINRSKNAVINKFKGSYKLTIAVGVSLFFLEGAKLIFNKKIRTRSAKHYKYRE